MAVNAYGQPWLSVGGAGEGGWWAYHKGFDANGEFLGTDRTRHALRLSAVMSGGWRFKRMSVGAEVVRTEFWVRWMEASDNSSTYSHTYRVADRHVTFVSYRLMAALKVLERSWFSLWPRATFGSFTINTTHPGQHNFGAKLAWSGGVEGRFRLSCHLTASVSVNHSTMCIAVKNGLEGEKHRIFGSGVQGTLNYNFRRCNMRFSQPRFF